MDTGPIFVLRSYSYPEDVKADTESPVFFFGAEKPNGFLSQMFPCEFEWASRKFCNLEQYFQVAKAMHFGDKITEQKLLATTDPKKHKEIGREVTPFDKQSWDEVSYEIVRRGNHVKFTMSKDAASLQTLLRETGNNLLAEASPYDKTWGIGFGRSKAMENQDKWGKNLLGKAIMEVRKALQDATKMGLRQMKEFDETEDSEAT